MAVAAVAAPGTGLDGTGGCATGQRPAAAHAPAACGISPGGSRGAAKPCGARRTTAIAHAPAFRGPAASDAGRPAAARHRAVASIPGPFAGACRRRRPKKKGRLRPRPHPPCMAIAAPAAIRPRLRAWRAPAHSPQSLRCLHPNLAGDGFRHDRDPAPPSHCAAYDMQSRGRNNRGCGPPACMRMRYVRSLTEEEWDRVVAALKRGPTPEQVEALRVAKERTAHLFPCRCKDRDGQ